MYFCQESMILQVWYCKNVKCEDYEFQDTMILCFIVIKEVIALKIESVDYFEKVEKHADFNVTVTKIRAMHNITLDLYESTTKHWLCAHQTLIKH